jgi:hypothetical protein
MSKTILAAHGLSVIIAYSLLLYLYAFTSRIHVDDRQLMITASMGLFAGIGAFTGFWSMAKRSGKSESVVLATSTVLAIFLLIMCALFGTQTL